MKKLIFCLAVAILGASCFKKAEVTPSPVAPGINIYNAASLQNSLSMEPANVAFRLFVLLKEAQEQDVAIDNVTVTYKGSSSKLIQLLFGNGAAGTTVIAPETGSDVWTIKYNEYDYNSFDKRAKGGTILVDTGGKLLDEAGASWTVSSLYPDRFYMKVSGYNTYLDFSGMTINQLSPDTWTIDCSNMSCSSNMYSSSAQNVAVWAVGFTLNANLPTAATTFFAKIAGGDFSLSGSGYGTSFYWDVNAFSFTYDIVQPMHYTLACGNIEQPFTGEEACSIISSTDISVDYPSDEIRIEWTYDPSDRCRLKATAYYNGYQTVVL